MQGDAHWVRTKNYDFGLRVGGSTISEAGIRSMGLRRSNVLDYGDFKIELIE